MKFILIIIFFTVFFEAGLISSYTIITAQPPDVGKLVGMQVDELISLLNFGSNSNFLTPPSTIKVNNPDDVVAALKSQGGLDGINLNSLLASIIGNSKDKEVPVNITLMGYKDAISGNSSGGQIVISPNESYSLTASAKGTVKNGGVTIDVTTIQITSTRKLYGNVNGT